MRGVINAIASRISRKYLAQIALVCAAQFAAGKVGDALQTVNDGGIGPVWPASGIALAALLLWDYSVWPGVAAGAFLLAFLSPLPHWAAVLYAAGTTLAAALGVFLLRRITKFDNSLSHLRDALGLIILGAFVSSIVSASIGASILFANLRSWSGLGSAWLVYWLGDSTGVLLVAPVTLTFPNILRTRDRKRITELALFLVVLIIGGFVVFGDFPLVRIKLHILTFAVLPFVMWAAIRLGVSATALSIFAIGTVATVETALGSGPFTTNTPIMNAVLLDVFFAVVSITGLILAAAIAEREQAERERARLVRERAEADAQLRFAAIVESSEDAIISGTLDGLIVSWNAGARRMYGYTEAEVTGKPITILVPPELKDEENKILETLKLGRRIEQLETIRVTKTGKRINVSLSISPIKDSSGRIVGISGIARDITERKLAEEALRESEEKFRSVFRDAGVGMVIVSPEGRFLAANRTFCDCLGYTEEELLAKALESVTLPEDWPAFSQKLGGAITEGIGLRRFEKRCLHKSGRIVYTESSASLIRNRNGEPRYLVGGVLDITKRKEAEETLSDMTRKLVEAQEKERARIARELHDDINQRLAMLAIELEQLQDDPSEVRSRVQELRKQTTEISNDVQALSHDLHSSQLEYLGAVAGMKSWCKEFGERQGMQIDCRHDVRSTLPREIGLCLFRVLQEALHNAAKHSGVKRIEVELIEDLVEIHLTIRDLGKGFDIEAARQGRGLGLTSMRERVRLVNGAITIESKPTGGTTIRVRVPLESNQNPAQTA
jgi:PAS domain S-box-containing protein